MYHFFRISLLMLLLFGCKKEGRNLQIATLFQSDLIENELIQPEGAKVIDRINVPKGFQRVEVAKNSFGSYLRNFPLKPHGSEVYLYNGNKKNRQDVHVAILDISVGNKDLQQCADATMRLRAEYLYQHKKFDSINFDFTNGFNAKYSKWRQGFRIKVDGNKVTWVETKTETPSDSYKSFMDYMEKVFMYAGTLSLSNQLALRNIDEIQIGDVFVMGGSPGHAVIVLDLAENDKGEKVMLIAQSYMPAQEIHILKNPENEDLSPWYSVKSIKTLQTPEWKFNVSQLRKW